MPDRFVDVAHIDEIPEDEGLRVTVDNTQIALFRVDGEVFALYNICPHQGGPLAEGFVEENDCTVECPLHGWYFDLRSGREIHGQGRTTTYEVRVDDGRVHLLVSD